MSETAPPGGGFGGAGSGFGGPGGGPRGPRREFDRRPSRDGDRERGPMSVKARLRAKARKKARKAAKKKGGFLRKKVCRFCAEPRTGIDYKDPKGLRYFITETGKMIPQRISGNCARHQREIGVAIKRARHLALLPFASQHGG
jgi:small subunit ribosomal protein S18